MKIALLRLDKIGDLVCTLPVDEILSQHQCTWFVSSGLRFICDHAEPQRSCIEINKATPWQSFWKLYHHFKNQDYKMAVNFQNPWWVSFALWLAGVKYRVGGRSQWHHFLFLNLTLRQKRSLALKHELDYNLELLQYAIDKVLKPLRGEAHENSHLSRTQNENLRLKLRPPKPATKKDFIVIHPGMAGSALNWPQEKYVELIQKLIKNNPVVITGTSADEPYLDLIKLKFENQSQVRWTVGQLSVNELLQTLSEAQSVVAPSTGVAHLAAALGTPVRSPFSPVLVHQARRWSPRGNDVQTFSPAVSCPATHHCLKEKCAFYDCMKLIEIDQVMDSLP